MSSQRTDHVIHAPRSYIDYDKPWANQRQMLVTDQTATFLSNFLAIFLSLALKNVYNIAKRVWIVCAKKHQAESDTPESHNDGTVQVDQTDATHAAAAPNVGQGTADVAPDAGATNGEHDSGRADSAQRQTKIQRMEMIEDSHDSEGLSWASFKRFSTRLSSLIPMESLLHHNNLPFRRRMMTIQFWQDMRRLAKESSGDLVWHFIVGSLALCLYFGTLVIGVWSSYPLIGNSVALSHHPQCGLYGTNASHIHENPYNSLALRYFSDTGREARQYAKACYGSTKDPRDVLGQDSCSFFYTTTLNYKIEENTKCPFKSGEFQWCLGGKDSAFKLTTWSSSLDDPFIDASTLGVNSPEPYTFSRSLTCSPLHTHPFIRPVVGKQNHTLHFRYSYGRRTGYSNCTGDATHCSFEIQVFPLDEYPYVMYSDSTTYYWPWTWDPLFYVNETAGEAATLILVSNLAIYYANKSIDPIFPAETQTDDGRWFNANLHASVLGCMSTTLACYGRNPEQRICTNVGDIDSLGNPDDPNHKATLSLLISSLSYNLQHQLDIGAQTLDAMDLLYGSSSAEVPDGQWKTEVRYMFESLLARTQIEARNVARGRGAAIELPDHINYTEPGKYVYCTKYKFRAQGWKNISVAWLVVELVVGFVVCVLGVTRENGDLWVEKHFNLILDSRAGWIVADIMEKCGEHLSGSWAVLCWICICCWPFRRSA